MMIRELGIIAPFVGGKRQLAPTILPLIPPHKTYVEAFGGAAAIFFLKPESRKSVLNDLDPSLIGFYRKFSCRKVDDCKKIRNVCGFAKKARQRVRRGSSDVCDQIAARRFSIVGDVQGGMKTEECQIRPIVTKRLEKKCPTLERRLRNATITNKDFREVARKYDAPDTFQFWDPPYPRTTQPTRFKASAIAPSEVCEVARTLKGKVLITYNDLPEIRKACSGRGLHVEVVPSKHRSKHVSKGKAETTELLITNFPLRRNGK